MTSIIFIMAISAVFGAVIWSSEATKRLKKCDTKSGKAYIGVVLAVGFVIRIIAAAFYRGHETDMNCFTGWSDLAFGNGLSQFYLSDGFHDYPPGYVYIMYILGAVKNLFSLNGPALWVVLKLPAIIADLGMGYMAYNLSSKKLNKSASALIAGFFVFNPAVILNSSFWGQVDSILAFFSVLAVYLIAEKKLYASFFAFAAAFLIKPQALFFAPVILFGVTEQVFMNGNFTREKLIKTVACALGATAFLLVSFMPFGTTPLHGIEIIINQYIETMGQYDYATVNAFNLYGALGLNWTELNIGLSVAGWLLMIAVVIYAAVIFFKKEGTDKYYLTAFVIIFGIYMFAPKMHERYAFPGIFLLIMLLAQAPTKRNFILYGLFSLSQFFNIAWVLFVYETNTGMYYKSPVIIAASVVNLILFAWAIYTVSKDRAIGVTAENKSESDTPKKSGINSFKRSEKLVRLTAFDITAILVITAVYSAVAFYKLGDKYAPETETALCQNKVVIDLGEEKEISSTAFFLGARNLDEDRNLTISYLDNNHITVYYDIVDSAPVFSWTIREDTKTTARYVVLSTNCKKSPTDPTDMVYLKELCLLDNNGEIITPINTENSDVSMLFDEQEYLTLEKSYMANTYFDEIYHPRTAYEFLHQMSVYEWTHPPLGKVIMGIGITLFGMTPFGWRFAGTLFGILMVPFVYLFARRSLKYKWLAVLSCVLFTFDFMHFTQTRLATIDTYVTFFIMLMYYYMYKYYKKSFYDTPLYKTLIPLGISGIFFGFSVASKWTGLYAGLGLAIIFFITVYDRYREYKYALLNPNGNTDGISHKAVIEGFKKNTLITLLFCCVMFIAVPFGIYALSYIPYMNTPSGEGFKTIFTNAGDMLTYHSKTVVNSTHAYSSYWFEWPIMYRPIWYFSKTLDNGLKQGISAFGNPAVWWTGIAAVAYNLAICIIVPLKRKNYYGRNKYLFAVCYALIFAVFCVFAGVSGANDEKLVRLFPYVVLYSVVIVGVFLITMMFDYRLKQTSSRTPLFLLLGYFSGYMPWMLVLRTTYIYHYFPCVVFVVLMIAYSIKTFYDNAERKKVVVIASAVYGAVTIGLFVLFYPVLSGQPISLEFAETWLKWFESWVLVA